MIEQIVANKPPLWLAAAGVAIALTSDMAGKLHKPHSTNTNQIYYFFIIPQPVVKVWNWCVSESPCRAM